VIDRRPLPVPVTVDEVGITAEMRALIARREEYGD